MSKSNILAKWIRNICYTFCFPYIDIVHYHLLIRLHDLQVFQLYIYLKKYMYVLSCSIAIGNKMCKYPICKMTNTKLQIQTRYLLTIQQKWRVETEKYYVYIVSQWPEPPGIEPGTWSQRRNSLDHVDTY